MSLEKCLLKYFLDDSDISLVTAVTITIEDILANPLGEIFLYDTQGNLMLDINGNPMSFSAWKIDNNSKFYICWTCELPKEFYSEYNENGYNTKKMPLSRYFCGIRYYDSIEELQTQGFQIVRQGAFSDIISASNLTNHIKNNSHFYVGNYDELTISDGDNPDGNLTIFKYNVM